MVTVHAMRTYDDLRRVLAARAASLPAGQARLADLFLRDPEGCAFRTIGEVAKLADVHQSSVVRFAHALGLDGFPALAGLCRDHLRQQAQLVRRLDQAVSLGAADLLAQLAAQEQANISRTFARIDPAVWERVTSSLADGPKIHVVGMRKCSAVAELLSYLLRMVRREVYQMGLAKGDLVEELRDIAAGEVMVVVSIHRYSRDTVTAARTAAGKGLTVIALTDNPGSPLVPHASSTLFVEASGVTVLRSITALVSLSQALATAAAVRLGAESRQALLLEEDLLNELGIYHHGPDHAAGRGAARRRSDDHP